MMQSWLRRLAKKKKETIHDTKKKEGKTLNVKKKIDTISANVTVSKKSNECKGFLYIRKKENFAQIRRYQ